MADKRPTTDRIRNGFNLVLTALGAGAIGLSLGAEIIGLDLTPGFGIIQMVQLLVGLTFLTIAGYVQIYGMRASDAPRSLQADIGIRLGATGLVFSYIAGLSDLVGIGTHIQPNFERPFVGPFQLIGMGVGVLLVTTGLTLYFTSRGTQPTSSLEFLIEKEQQAEPANAPTSS